MTLLENVLKVIGSEVDSETVFRSMVALGTSLSMGSEVKEAANTVFGVKAAISHAVRKVKEPRIQRLAAEIEKLL